MESTARVIERVKVLLKLTKSPFPEEAATAAEMAEKLLIAHNLSMADVVEGAQEVGEITIKTGRHSKTWRMMLLVVIAECNFCGHLVVRGPSGLYAYKLIGRSHCLAGAKVLFEYLEATAARTVSQACAGKGKRYRDQYLRGIVTALVGRLEETFKRCTAGQEEKALMIRPPRAANSRSSKIQLLAANTSAFFLGKAAGQQISLARQVGRGRRRSLGARNDA